jgi:hypothetical protein
MKRSALFAAVLLAGVVAAAEPGFRAGPWLALQSYEESVKIEDIKSDWQTAALGLRAAAETGVGRDFDLAFQLNTGLSLTDTEEWISRGQTLQLNDADLWLIEGQARLERPWTSRDTVLTPGLAAEYRYQDFQRSKFRSRASGLLGQVGSVDEELYLWLAGPTLELSRPLSPGTRVATRLTCLWLLDGEVRNSLIGSTLDAESGRVTSLELAWEREAAEDRAGWTVSLFVEHQSLKGTNRERLVARHSGEPVYEYVEWPDNVLDTIAVQVSRGFRF